MMISIHDIANYYQQNEPFVIVTVLDIKGSAPCSMGMQTIIQSGDLCGSIGGGNLEYQVCEDAHEFLAQNKGSTVKQYNLGAVLGQCCGGLIKVLFTPFYTDKRERELTDFLSHSVQHKTDFVWLTLLGQRNTTMIYHQGKLLGGQSIAHELNARLCAQAKHHLEMEHNSPEIVKLDSDNAVFLHAFLGNQTPDIAVFGAGHIARALMPLLAKMPVNIYWIDDRADEFAHYPDSHPNVKVVCDDFVDAIDDLPSDAYHLVISYSHTIDFAVCEKLLNKDDFAYLGLIGSVPKSKRFRKRLLARGLSLAKIDKLICPIGVKFQTLKSPTAVAVSIAMDLLNFLDNKTH